MYILKKPQICCLRPDSSSFSSFSLLSVLFGMSNSIHLNIHFLLLASFRCYFFPSFQAAVITLREQMVLRLFYLFRLEKHFAYSGIMGKSMWQEDTPSKSLGVTESDPCTLPPGTQSAL